MHDARTKFQLQAKPPAASRADAPSILAAAWRSLLLVTDPYKHDGFPESGMQSLEHHMRLPTG